MNPIQTLELPEKGLIVEIMATKVFSSSLRICTKWPGVVFPTKEARPVEDARAARAAVSALAHVAAVVTTVYTL